MPVVDLQTKRCPFCAETIQRQAVKCRFCGEFLNSDRARALENNSNSNSEPDEQGAADNKILFWGRPSLWGIAPTVIKGLAIFVLAVILIKLPLDTILKVLRIGLTDNQLLMYSKYKLILGLGLAAAVISYLLLRIIRLKMTYYEVMADRIEWGRGILDRKVDNLDMFRVIDLKMRRSIFDCIVGIGTVVLITTDKTDPEFVFGKIRNPRQLYDIIKKASLDADRRTRVVHLE